MRVIPPPAPVADWDDAYANGAHIADAAAYPPRWAREAAAHRAAMVAAGRASLGLSYGPGPREVLDLFSPAGAPVGLAVFVHGGYWRAFDGAVWSHLASGALERGWAVAVPTYPLCPDVTIAEITTRLGRAVGAAAALAPGPIRLAGHSAGGHLACRMICRDGPLGSAVAARVGRVLSISGLHDLRPLLRTGMNADLRLDAAGAAAESPALAAPVEGAELVAWVGAEERPEFRRQNALIANVWRGLGAATIAHEAAGRHHFDVIDDLVDPESAMVAAWLG